MDRPSRVLAHAICARFAAAVGIRAKIATDRHFAGATLKIKRVITSVSGWHAMFNRFGGIVALALTACVAIDAVAADTKPLEPYTVIAPDGIPLNVVETGVKSAPALLFVHGVGQSYQSWTAQLHSDLASQFHLVAFDLRGHGGSGKPWQPDAYNNACTWADDVAAVMTATKAVRPILVVWSYGGTIGMDYVRCRGIAGLSGIVFVAARSGLYPNARLDPRIPLSSEKMKSSNLETNMQGSIEFTSFLTSKPLPPDVASGVIATNLMYPAYARRANDGPKSLPDGTTYKNNEDQIGELSLPLLFMLGEKDAFSPASEAVKQIRSRFPGANVITYADVGHWISFEAADAFNADLRRFADQVFEKKP
jgi:non-heme chloroperoxidase